jgi:phosphoglycolate phosphatase
MPELKGFIFDLDGTLLYTLEDIAAAENRALAELNLPPRNVEEYRWIVGGGADDIARRLLPADMHTPEQIAAFVQRFRTHYHQNWHERTRLYDGIAELLSALRQQDFPLAVLSNKPEEFALKIVDWFFPGWQGNSRPALFTHVIGQRVGVPVKPDPALALQIARDWGLNPAAVAFLGDSDIDIYTALNAGMIPVGAEWGFRGRKELVDSGARILLNTPLDLLAYLNIDGAQR